MNVRARTEPHPVPHQQKAPPADDDTYAIICGPPIMIKFTQPVLDTLGYSHDNIITQNDFTGLQADRDIALGASTHNNKIFDNVGVKSIFRAAGSNDRNSVNQD